jgi:hypothetical protein
VSPDGLCAPIAQLPSDELHPTKWLPLVWSAIQCDVSDHSTDRCTVLGAAFQLIESYAEVLEAAISWYRSELIVK